MNLPQSRKVTALLSDSKGPYLQDWVSSNSKDSEVKQDIKWWWKRSRTTPEGLIWLTRKFNRKLRSYGDLHIYCWLGSCDLTGKTGRYIFLKDTELC